MRKTPKLVKVVWRDIIGTSGWEKAEEVNPPVIQTTGYLIQKNRKVVKVANTQDDKGEWSSITAFPTGCIEEIIDIL